MTAVSVDPESLAVKLRLKLSSGTEVFQSVEGLWGFSILEEENFYFFFYIFLLGYIC